MFVSSREVLMLGKADAKRLADFFLALQAYVTPEGPPNPAPPNFQAFKHEKSR